MAVLAVPPAGSPPNPTASLHLAPFGAGLGRGGTALPGTCGQGVPSRAGAVATVAQSRTTAGGPGMPRSTALCPTFSSGVSTNHGCSVCSRALSRAQVKLIPTAPRHLLAAPIPPSTPAELPPYSNASTAEEGAAARGAAPSPHRRASSSPARQRHGEGRAGGRRGLLLLPRLPEN